MSGKKASNSDFIRQFHNFILWVKYGGFNDSNR